MKDPERATESQGKFWQPFLYQIVGASHSPSMCLNAGESGDHIIKPRVLGTFRLLELLRGRGEGEEFMGLDWV